MSEIPSNAATLREQAAAYRDQAAHWRALAKYADSYQAGDYDLGRARELEQLAAALDADASAMEHQAV
jgi:hypothetical protein